jgi:hypothetical protein
VTEHYVYRKYRAEGVPDLVRERLTASLVEKKFVQTGNSGDTVLLRYLPVTFSSKRPLTCISRLSLEVTGRDGKSVVKIGATFTKIRYFTIGIMVLFCVVIPAAIGIMQRGVPDLPPMSLLGIPIGFMIQYHVRWRIFRALGRLVYSIGEQ